MAINIKFDLNGNPEMPTIILATRSGEKLGQLDAKDIELSDKLVGASEITFILNKYVNNKITNLWDKVTNFKLVYCKEWDLWFEIRVELDEETETVKTVFCTQLGQAELSQIMLYDIEINTEKDIERDDYKISILYDQDDPKSSILMRLLDKVPHYSIIHVDSTIARIQRSFSFNDTSVYDAFQDIAKEIGCLFVFNSNSDEKGKVQRTISVYDLQQNCLNPDCRYRGEFTDVCPKCNGKNIKPGYGDDTLIFVTADELAADNIQFVTDTDSVKNCFKLEAGDDLMTATIRNCNPNGTDYIWHFSDDTKQDMSEALTNKIKSYDEMYKHYYNNYSSDINSELLIKYNALIDKYSIYEKELKPISTPIKGYSSLMKAYYDVIDLALYLESSLMPNITMGETNAEKQSALLTGYNLSPVSVTNIETASLATVNNAVLSMARTLVKSTYKVSIKNSNLNGTTWRGSFTVTNYSDDDDTADTSTVAITINDDYESFVEQKLEKALSKEDTDDLSVSGLFKKNDTAFRAELKKYALKPLESFHNACQSCIDVLIEQGLGNPNNNYDLYVKLYAPYYNKLAAIEVEMKLREDEISVIKGKYDLNGNLLKDGLAAHIEEIKSEIQEKLDFENYLGKDLWLEFSVYRREDKYSNDNYISDGLDNAQLFDRALEFIEVAENEIFKSSELQHSISTSLNNLLAIKKFEPLINSFKVGNWLRVQVDDQIYKLRLLEYEISYEDFGNIPVVFSDVTKVKNGLSDLEDVLSQASSMATSYDSLQKQASKANVAKGTIDEWLEYGLNSALVQIQNNNSEEITINESGLLCRSYSDITEDYSPEQLKLTHNIMAYTDDNWKTVRQAIGKHLYVTYDAANDTWIKDNLGYGMSADFVTAGQIMGSRIVGGEIYSANYVSGITGNTPQGTYINLNEGDFEFGGKKLVYNSSDNTLTLRGVTIEWDDTTPPATSDIEGLDDYLNQLDGRIQTYSQVEDPSLEWDTDEEKAAHAGDLWINPETGITKRWNGTTWEVVTDSELIELAQSKAQIFTVTPYPPYYVGDLWVQGETGDILHCIKAKAVGELFDINDWKKSSKYTDDTRADEAFGLADSAKGIAENAKILGETLSEGLGFKTQITGEYVISPVIAGGTLLIGDLKGTYAQITTYGKLICQNAQIHGEITATSLTLGTDVTISSDDVDGLSSVATSGKYSDLTGKPSIPDSVEDLGLDSSTIIYKGDITQTKKSDENGISYIETKVPTSSGYITYDTYDSGDYIVFGRSKGTNSEGNDYVCISKNGLLTARNALIYGTVYATEGEFAGKITADEGEIGCWNIGTIPWLNYGDSLYATASDADYQYVTFLRNSGVPSSIGFGIKQATYNSSDNYSSSSFSDVFYVKNDGSLFSKKADIEGTVTATSGRIGNWNIEETGEKRGSLYSTNGDYKAWIHTPFLANQGSGVVYGIYKNDTPTFYVTTEGGIFAKQAIIQDGFRFGNNSEYYVASDGYMYVKQTLANEIRVGYTTDGDGFAHTVSIYGSTGEIYTEGDISAIGDITADGNITAFGDISIEEGSLYLRGEEPTYAGAIGIDTYGKVINVSSSSERYKENITEDYSDELNPENLYKIPVKQFNYKDEYKDITINPNTQIGLIAEDVDKYFPSACCYNKQGRIEGWHDRLIIPAMLKLIQNQKLSIDSLYQKYQSLAKELDAIKSRFDE